eukprot:scaffold39563_cov205-Skeletonema_dohrnii-CCMP3373.AAC.2
MLAGLPSLKELYCHDNPFLTGNLNSLRVLKDTLAIVHISFSHHVQGNFMDLADFPGLRTLNLRETSVIGDIRDIGEGDFPSLESLTLPKGVYGGTGYEFQHISDGPDIAMAVNSIKKQRPSLLIESWHASLSEDSPDWYGLDDEFDGYYGDDRAAFPSPPLHVRLVTAGSRVGYRWETIDGDHPCKVNWLDPEPHRESSDYEKYIRELRVIERQVRVFRGFQQPPAKELFNNHERKEADIRRGDVKRSSKLYLGISSFSILETDTIRRKQSLLLLILRLCPVTTQEDAFNCAGGNEKELLENRKYVGLTCCGIFRTNSYAGKFQKSSPLLAVVGELSKERAAALYCTLQ